MLVISCAELFQKETGKGGITRLKVPSELKPWEFESLHQEGKKLIHGWFESARNLIVDDADHFEGFIYLWIAFNSWASCVSDADRDRDRDIIDSHSLLPIFDAKDLTKNNIIIHEYQFALDWARTRGQRRSHYFEAGADRFEPKCWKRHCESNEEVPLDWPHILNAIYKVRCNLFHGHKGIHSEMDKEIVSSAFLTLIHFIRNSSANLIGNIG